MKVFVKGIHDNEQIKVPLSSAVIVYLANYCHVPTRPLHICVVSCKQSDASVTLPTSSLGQMTWEYVDVSDVPASVLNCVFPVIQDDGECLIRCGLCCTARHIIKVCHNKAVKSGNTTLIDLLGFRAGSLKACAEVSGWTKLCEVELPDTVATLIQTVREDSLPCSLDIPEDVMKLELHFDKPPPLHNDDKKKRLLLREVLDEFEQQNQLSDKNDLNSNAETSKTGTINACVNDCNDKLETLTLNGEIDQVDKFFAIREQVGPHGNMYFRVQTKQEKDEKKFVNSDDGGVCKFGCTEDKLIKWCAKCNDREKLRRKEEKQMRNNARLDNNTDQVVTSNETETSQKSAEQLTNGNSYSNTDNALSIFEKPTNTGVGSMKELKDFAKTLTLYDILYEHVYSEGICFTVADIFLFVYIYHLLESMKFQNTKLLDNLPNIKKWLSHVITLPRMQQTSSACGFKMAALTACVTSSQSDWFPVEFNIPPVTLDLEEDNDEIGRSAKAKHRALKKEIARVLGKVKTEQISPAVGHHPYGTNVHIDWSSVPQAASPKIELPEKRVARKCEQLENLATAVQAIAKPGDVIVDFCSGAGHLGIIIAHLLPDCQVYLIENKEESLIRARDRVLQLQLKNVTLYQCNLDYFQGQFDIGTCLHACGVATDLVLQQCLDRSASFVICPCCYGSIQNTHLISYPRSRFFQHRQMDDKDLVVLGHAADQTEKDTNLYQQGRDCMNLVDTDRAQLAIEQGYSVTLCSLQPLSCTPKNNMLIGTRVR